MSAKDTENILSRRPSGVIIFVLTATVGLLLLSGCNSIFGPAKSNNDKTINDLIDHFRDDGLKIDAVVPFPRAITRCKATAGIKISGVMVGVFQFDKRRQKAAAKIDKFEEQGFVYISGNQYPALVNGSFLIIGYHENPQRELLIKSFESF